jgi:hypothetical protein
MLYVQEAGQAEPTEQVIDAGGLTPESTDEEIEEAALCWAQDNGCYADPEGEEP